MKQKQNPHGNEDLNLNLNDEGHLSNFHKYHGSWVLSHEFQFRTYFTTAK